MGQWIDIGGHNPAGSWLQWLWPALHARLTMWVVPSSAVAVAWSCSSSQRLSWPKHRERASCCSRCRQSPPKNPFNTDSIPLLLRLWGAYMRFIHASRQSRGTQRPLLTPSVTRVSLPFFVIFPPESCNQVWRAIPELSHIRNLKSQQPGERPPRLAILRARSPAPRLGSGHALSRRKLETEQHALWGACMKPVLCSV